VAAEPSDPGGRTPSPGAGGGIGHRLPRFLFWIAGGAIAVAGAIGARKASYAYPDYRIVLWMAGSAVIFLGLAVLSMGSRNRLGDDDEEEQGDHGR
jgi:hypothetical protein